MGTDWYSNQAARTTSPCRRQANLSQIALLAAAEGDSSTDTETTTATGFGGRQLAESRLTAGGIIIRSTTDQKQKKSTTEDSFGLGP